MKNIFILILLLTPLLSTANIDTCRGIKKNIDKFNGEIKYYTPPTAKVTFQKVIKDSITVYYMTLTAYGNTLSTGEKGITILLDNGIKIDRPTELINVSQTIKASEYDLRGNWEYSAFIRLSESEINLLIQHSITDYRLYIYDNTVLKKERPILKQWLRCLISEQLR